MNLDSGWRRNDGDSGDNVDSENAVGSEKFVMDYAFWGPSYSDDEIKVVLDGQHDALESAGCTVESLGDAALFERTAAAIAKGQVIGWFQGRMEWGLGRWGIVRYWVTRDVRI